jgi:hypothetical protein
MNENLFRKYFLNSWWVIAFAMLCAALYEQGLKERQEDMTRLSAHLHQLQQQKEIALAVQNDLQTKITSQSDRAWIELILMKNLGLTPEGYQKVLFTNDATVSMQ